MKSRFLLICSVLLIAVAVAMCGIKFVKHERRQNDRIAQLEGNISLLQEELQLANNPPEITYSDEAYNYLAIGNSITKHGLCDYWWNEIGCAASASDKDYYHIVTAYLQEQHDDVCSYAYNFNAWEVQATDRAETLALLDQYLDPRLDLVTLQLSENVTNTETFETDFLELVEYIKNKAPLL